MNNKGFTLIELLVSVGIFTIVVVVALGALLAVAESDRKMQTLKTVTNNLGFALESMSRTIRTGADYSCGSFAPGANCAGSSGGALFTFTPVCQPGFACPPPRVGYQRSSDAALCGQESTGEPAGCIVRSQNGGSTWSPITAPEVVVQDFRFYLVGAPRGSPDSLQPRATITAVGYVRVSDAQKSEFRIQTTVTQRLYDQ